MDNKDPVVPIKGFLDPEDLYFFSTYLLFSDERSKEKERESKVVKAFYDAGLTPQRLRVHKSKIILECSGFHQVMSFDRVRWGMDPLFDRLFMPAIYEIFAGELPKEKQTETEGRTYNFRQPYKSQNSP